MVSLIKSYFGKCFLAMIIVLGMFMQSFAAVCAAPTDTVVVKLHDTMLQLNQAAFEREGRILLPVRSLMETAGNTVTWIDSAQGALITGEDTFGMVYAETNTYQADYVTKMSENTAVMINGSLYCDADVAADILCLSCEFESAAKILTLTEKIEENSAADNSVMSLIPYEDTYVQGGTNSANNYGEAANLGVKGLAGDTNRLIYMKFKLSGLRPEMIGKANLNMESNWRTTENRNRIQPFYFHEVDPNSWSENTLTFDTQPERGAYITEESPVWSTAMSFNLTDFVKNAVETGKKEISFVISGPPDGTRVEFSSREGDSAPCILIDEDASSYHKDLPTKEGFGEGQDPWEWARKLVAESKYEKTQRFGNEYITALSRAKYQVVPTDAVFAQAGSDSEKNFADSTVLETKTGAETANTTREAFLKFDISGLPSGEISYAYVNLYCTMLENSTTHTELMRLADKEWSEQTLTWSNRPAAGKIVAKAQMTGSGAWHKFDLTDAVAEARKNGTNIISLVITDTAAVRTAFSSKNGSNPPELMICVDDGSLDFTSVPANQPDEYTLNVNTIVKNNREKTIPNATRALETLPGYTITNKAPQLGKYGGRLDKQVEATGFYYTKKIGDRWWIVDPEGYLMVNMGVTTVTPSDGTPLGKEGMEREYGTAENWAEQTMSYMKNDLYFNGVGGFSRIDALYDTTDGQYMSMTTIAYMLRSYMASIGIGFAATGSTMFNGGAFNVFDPDFETFCDSYAAEKIAPRKDWKNFLGWMSDNELQCDSTMLDSFLMEDWSDPLNAYTYAAAWTFLIDYTGKENPTLADVDDHVRQDFLDFMYDRYHSVVSGAIRKYDPNHMYLGVRAVDKTYTSRGYWAAAGRWCDIICVNYYGAWTPDNAMMTDWSEWSGNAPFIVTEWYAMALDSGLNCSSGAGFLVAAQEDRGRFYQNFALKLLETKNCVGFHWFQYLDNDPTAVAGDASNVDSNKGIISIYTYKPYEPLVTEMAELNKQVYSLIDYFDS